MGRKNKFVIILLGIFLFLMSLSPNLTTAEALNEQTNYDVYLKSADFLAGEGIIKSVSKTSDYNLYEGISRIEMLKIISKISKEELPQNCKSNFEDILSTHWGCRYSSWALEKKFISKNKLYRPNDDVSKVEALKMIFKVKNIEVEKTADWREGYVKKAVELGYSDLFSDYDQKATRGFVFDIIYKSLNNVELSNIDFEKQKVVLSFDENLNKNNIVSNLKIYPEVGYTTNWIDDKNLEIVLQDLINKDVEFLVNTLDMQTTKDVITKKFKITGLPTLDFVSPKGEITDVNQNIVVKFSKPIIELTNIDNQKSCPIKITPNIEGECHFITTSSFLFKPKRGFAYGAKYNVVIPSGIETFSGEKTLNGTEFQIYTPKFELKNQYFPKNIEDKLVFNFNDEVNLDDFKNNFRLTGFDNDKLNFSYLKSNQEDLKSGIEIFPKEKNWGYDAKFEYTIFKNLSSIRGNIGLNVDIIGKFTTDDFLKNYQVVKLISTQEEDKFNLQNFFYSDSNTIVSKDNQTILLNFDKEVKLDKSLFQLDHDFEINYPTFYEYENQKHILKTDKKSIVLSVKSKNVTGLKLKVLTSKISNSKDKTISFFVKINSGIDSFKNIDYETSCLVTTQNLLLNDLNYKSFKFNNYGEVNYIYLINEFDKYSQCKFKKGFYTYQLSTKLNPNSDYILDISKNLLDSDLYDLDIDYQFSFTTKNALNKDKNIDFIGGESQNIYPKYLENKTFSVLTTNLDKVFVEICYGDLDVENTDLVGNKNCKSKVLDVNNLGFKPNISVFGIEEIVGEKTDSQVYNITVSKLKEDKTDYELKSYFNNATKTYIFGDHFAFLAGGKSNILGIKNFLDDSKISEIEKIGLYHYENGLLGYSNKFKKDLKFEKLSDGNYKIIDEFDGSLLITLKGGEKIFLSNYGNSYLKTNNQNYITTSKPVYKPGETVQISGISYDKTISGVKLSNKKLQVYIRDSNYINILQKTVDVNDLGVFDFEYKLQDDAKLGNYNISVGNNSLSFKVENYIKPDFELNLDVNKDKIVSPNKAIFTIKGKYFAGLEVSSAKIDYTLSSTETNFKPNGFDQYTFGEDNFFDYYKGYYHNNNYKVEKNGTSYLNSNGELNLELDLDFSEIKDYNFEVTMFDPATNKQISKSIKLKGFQTSEMIGLKTDKYFYNVGDTANFEMIGVNLDNKMVKNSKFKLNIYKVDYKKVFGGNYTITQENKIISKDLVTLENGKVDFKNLFDKSGEYKIEILGNKGFKTVKNIYVGSSDILNPLFRDNGLILSLDKQEYNIGDTAKLNISSPKNNLKAILVFSRMGEVLEYKEINIDNNSLDYEFKVKDNFLPGIKINIFSYDLVKKLDKYDEYKKLKIEINELSQKIIKEKIEIIRPYLYSDLYLENEYSDSDLLKLNTLKRKEIDLLYQILPSYYTGDIDLKTNFKTISLNSNISLDKTDYKPKDDAKVIIDIKDNLGNEINGNVNISIIDKSLLSLHNNKTNLIESVYENSNNYLRFNSNIYKLIKSIDFKSEVFEVSSDNFDLSNIYSSGDVYSKSISNSMGFELKATSDYDLADGIMVESSPILSDEANTDNSRVLLRNNFKDLVYYNANVEVKDGKAEIDISKLPDNLTTWSIVGFAHTKDLKLGSFTKDFNVNTEVGILPILPKTLTVGDEINLGFNILNNTSNDLKTNFEIIASNLEIKSNTKTITLNKKSSTLVEFKAIVLDLPEGGNLDNYYSNIKLLLKSGKISDGFEDNIKINYPSTKEYVYTLGETNNLSFEEKLDFSKVKDYGNVSVNISAGATILTNLDAKLKEVIKFPYYDLSSKLTTLEQIDLLKEIYKQIGKTNIYNEIRVYDEYNKKSYSLEELKAEIIKEIPDYLTDKNLFSYYKDCDYSRFEYCGSFSLTKKYLLLNKQIPGIDNKKVYDAYLNQLQKNIKDSTFTNINDFLVPSIFKDLNFVNSNFKPDLKNISNSQKLDYINIYNNLGVVNTYSEQFYKELKNSVLIEAKTSFLPANSYFDDGVGVNSKFLKLALEKSEDNFLTKNIVRYLLNEFFKDNYYADKTSILNGILSYILHTDELSNLDLEFSGYFNGKEIISGKFDDKNMFESLNKNYLLSDLSSDFSNNQIGFETNGKNKLYYDIGVGYYLRSKEIESRDLGIQIERNYYDYEDFNNSYTKKCESFSWFNYCFEQKLKNPEIITKTKKGNKVIGEITITLDKPRQNLVINDFIPSGFELINSSFDTTSSNDKNISKNNGYWYNLAEYRYDGVYLYSQNLRPGTYTFRYVMQNINSGSFNLRPAFSQLIDDKQVWGRTKGGEFIVE